MSRIAGAQAYPIRPVRWIVGFPPGGPNDITARIMAEFLSERLHQQFAVENRPGAASNIATESVARSQPDGYSRNRKVGESYQIRRHQAGMND
jgi:tripartite-type tricarboxylate transporter receptor subunit TctC